MWGSSGTGECGAPLVCVRRRIREDEEAADGYSGRTGPSGRMGGRACDRRDDGAERGLCRGPGRQRGQWRESSPSASPSADATASASASAGGRHRLDDHRPPAHRPRGRPAGVDRRGQARPPHRLRPHLAREPDHHRHDRADQVRQCPARWVELCLEQRRHGRGAGPRRHALLRGGRSGEPELHGVGDRHPELPRRPRQCRRERGHVVVVRPGQLCIASEHHDLPHPHERAGTGLP